MTASDWATSLDRLFDDPSDIQALEWAEEAIKRGDCTPGQRRAFGLLTGGEDIIGLLAATSDGVRRLLDSVDPQRWSEAPNADEWNAIQIVHHLADNEAVNAVRIRAVLTEANPEVFGYDSDPWTRFFDIEPIEHAFERLVTGRRNTVALARSLSRRPSTVRAFFPTGGTNPSASCSPCSPVTTAITSTNWRPRSSVDHQHR